VAAATNSGGETTNAMTEQTAAGTASQSELSASSAAAPRDGSVTVVLHCQ